MTPEQEPLNRPHPSQGTGRPWTQAVLRDIAERSRIGKEQAAGGDPERGSAVTARNPRNEAIATGARGGRHRTAQSAPASRRTRPADTFDAATVTSRLRHGEPAHRRGLRWVRTLTGASRESIRLSELTTALQRPVTTGRRIAVTGARGGVGTTTVALLVASILAARREDAVLALDADPGLGSLVWRVGLPSDHVPANVAEQLLSGRVTDRQRLESLVPRTPEGLWVLGEPYLTAEGRPAAEEAASIPVAVAHGIGRFFSVTVLDCGGGGLLGWAAEHAALDAAHAAVLVAPATVDGIRSLQLALEGSAQRPDSRLAGSVIALASRTSTTEGVVLKAAMKYLSAHGQPVVHVPYDRHLAAGVPIELRRVGEPTLTAAMQVAGVALELAVGQ